MHPDDDLDFRDLKPGQTDPLLSQKINTIIIQHRDYIVYLDGNLNTQWNIKDGVATPGLGDILNRISILESKSDFISQSKWKRFFSDFLISRFPQLTPILINQSLLRIRSMLGEAIARIFDGNEVDQARSALEEAEQQILTMNAEYSRRWYYEHALKFAFVTLIIAMLAWIGKDTLITLLGRDAFEVFFCSMFGAVGAYVFVAKRGEKIELDAMSGAAIHKLEANARLTTGIVSAALVCLSIKSHILFASISNSSELKFMLMMSILAGYSERIIPNMVKKIDGTTNRNR